MSEFDSTLWKLSVPHDWKAFNDPECVTFESAAGLGVLQISAASKNGVITDEDLRDLAEDHLAAGATAVPVRAGDFIGFSLRYHDNTQGTRQWYLRCADAAVFVTYSCAIEVAGEEDELVDSILETLQARKLAL